MSLSCTGGKTPDPNMRTFQDALLETRIRNEEVRVLMNEALGLHAGSNTVVVGSSDQPLSMLSISAPVQWL